MAKLGKLWGMAKESFNDQRDRQRESEADDKLDRRAERIEQRGRRGVGRDGIFDPTEDVLMSSRQRVAPPQLSDDKLNAALGSLHDKLIDDDFEVTGDGDATRWVHDHPDTIVVLTDRRLLLLRNEKVLNPDDILAEHPIDRIEGFSHKRSMKGNKLYVSFKDGSTLGIPVETEDPEAFKVRFESRPLG
jgi:hypothetical protein